jgi:hypothetical protein
MSQQQTVEKLQAWVESHPESADTPFMNLSTGQEFTIRGLLKSLQASLAGEAQLSEPLQAELKNVETWIGGL